MFYWVFHPNNRKFPGPIAELKAESERALTAGERKGCGDEPAPTPSAEVRLLLLLSLLLFYDDCVERGREGLSVLGRQVGCDCINSIGAEAAAASSQTQRMRGECYWEVDVRKCSIFF